MSLETCSNCGSDYEWHWEEAFSKFGFNDGDGDVHTEDAACALRDAGYKVETLHWGFHNVIITEITKDGQSQIPKDVTLGYGNPRGYLPKDVIELLDKELSSISPCLW